MSNHSHPTTDDSTEPTIYAIEAVPEAFEILSRTELHPNDILETLPCTASLYMSPQFTNDGGADVGTSRHFVVELAYPPGVDDTIVQMDDRPVDHGTRLFQRFVRDLADDKGYEINASR
jgi:hypothetical protein